MNKILSIPKYKVQYNNGYTKDSSDIWFKYGSNTLYKGLDEDFKLFYRIIPYVIVEYEGHYLVKNSNGSFCFNLTGLNYIQEGIPDIHNPIYSVIANNTNKILKTTSNLSYIGIIKSIKERPNDIAIVYKLKLNKKRKPRGYEIMDINDLIEHCHKFDSFGIEYIDYLVSKKIRRK